MGLNKNRVEKEKNWLNYRCELETLKVDQAGLVLTFLGEDMKSLP
jgi:hypothetical protein